MSSVTRRGVLFVSVAGLAVAGTVLAAGGSVPIGPVQGAQRTVTVGLLDRTGTPVADVTTDDVIVREDGVAREVVRVAPGPPPTEVVILVDDSQAAATDLRDLRDALTRFTDRLADLDPPPAVRLATIGDRPTVVVDFTPSFPSVSRGIDRIATRPGSGATLLEAIDESAQALARRRAERPVIVAFLNEASPEFSTLTHQRVAQALRQVNASLWTIVHTRRDGAGSSDAEREREIVLGDVTRQSGGRHQTILASQHLPDAFTTLAAQLASRWAITYGRPDTLIPPSSLDVQARDRSWQVIAPRWSGR
ncbi:MAG: hypothetical protein ABS36_13630 [Acidobacteria bacterium SCN 69-37]|nr:MAG: hypothetical protein ABS36_13630 [Acidobacteria bacterium SCN 69-37]